MFSFLSEFLREVDRPCRVIVMDEEGLEQPRQYRVVPRTLLGMAALGGLALSLLVVALVVFTPLRELIPGYGTDVMRQGARLNALRVVALQDSLAMQQRYMNQLRQLMMGEVDTTALFQEGTVDPEQELPVSEEATGVSVTPRSQNWADHQQPALPISHMPIRPEVPVRVASAETRYLPSVQLPVVPPVNGFFTRGFDARTGHYAIDIAVEEGTMVRSIGDGYVILADWTYEGGYAIAVQHADGYVSVYKHNQRLLKRVGDRVRAREAIAMSGNSGEISSGPHLHFELWHNGLAQDPRYYIID